MSNLTPQPVKSFKLRGAFNCMTQLTPEQLAAGVITASAGNHAQGVAFSAKQLVRGVQGEEEGGSGPRGPAERLSGVHMKAPMPWITRLPHAAQCHHDSHSLAAYF